MLRNGLYDMRIDPTSTRLSDTVNMVDFLLDTANSLVARPFANWECLMAKIVRVQVLMTEEMSERFARYCNEKGFKKSTLIVRLVREHMDSEGFHQQPDFFRDITSTGEGDG